MVGEDQEGKKVLHIYKVLTPESPHNSNNVPNSYQSGQHLEKKNSHHLRTHSQRVLIEVRGFPLHHLDGHDAQRPDVHFGTILFSCDHFRCHPVRGTHHSGAFVLLRGDLSTETKVGWRGREGGREERGRREGGREGGREERGRGGREGGRRREGREGE